MTAVVSGVPLATQIAQIAALDQDRARASAEASALGPREVPKALIRAVRAELRALLDGDLEDNLEQIGAVTMRARELFMTIRGPGAKYTRGLGASGPQPLATMASSTGVYMGSSLQQVGGYANPEQFGAQAIRQLVSLVPEILAAKSNSPDKLMKAIAIAKKEGQEDIVRALRKKLLGDDGEENGAAPQLEAHEHHEHGANGVNGVNGAANGVVLDASNLSPDVAEELGLAVPS
jgi:hypothetical protein